MHTRILNPNFPTLKAKFLFINNECYICLTQLIQLLLNDRFSVNKQQQQHQQQRQQRKQIIQQQ